MPSSVIESYLVSIGFDPDAPGLAKFKGYLGEAESAVNFNTSGIVKSMLEWQAAITGAFTAVGLGVIGMADHVANADQSYRLLGLQMFMTQDRARTMKIATDALGESMEAIAWDPELHKRYQELIGDQERMGKALGMGDSYEKQLEGIRDIRFEFTRLKVEAEYLSMGFVSQLFTQMGAGPGTLLEKLRALNEWVETHIPELSRYFSTQLVPVLSDWKHIMLDTGGALQDLGLDFTNLVGLLTGSHELEGTTFSFEKMAGAIGAAGHEMAKFVDNAVLAERMLLHFADAAILALSGKFGDASKELHAGLNDITAGSGAILGIPLGATIGGGVGTAGGAAIGAGIGSFIGPEGTIIGGILGGLIGAPTGTAGGVVGGGIGGAVIGNLFHGTGEHGMEAGPLGHLGSVPNGPIPQMITDTAVRYHIDPALAHAMAMFESGERETDSNGKLIESKPGAMGVMQLMPATAAEWGVNPRDAGENIEGGLSEFASLLAKYKDTTKALEAYNWGEGNLDRALRTGARIPQDVQHYASGIESRARTLTINTLQVNVPQTAMTHQQIAKAVTDGVGDAMDRAAQNDLSEMAGVYH